MTRGARNPNLQVVIITHASHVCSQHLFGLPLKMNRMHRTQFDHALLKLQSLVIWSCLFWPSLMRNLREALTALEQKLLTFDLRSLSPALHNLWLLLVSLYVLFPYFRPRDGTPENCFFQLSSYTRASTCICCS